jgi:hypothetical protein
MACLKHVDFLIGDNGSLLHPTLSLKKVYLMVCASETLARPFANGKLNIAFNVFFCMFCDVVEVATILHLI